MFPYGHQKNIKQTHKKAMFSIKRSCLETATILLIEYLRVSIYTAVAGAGAAGSERLLSSKDGGAFALPVSRIRKRSRTLIDF